MKTSIEQLTLYVNQVLDNSISIYIWNWNLLYNLLLIEFYLKINVKSYY